MNSLKNTTIHQIINNLERAGAQILVRQLHEALLFNGIDSRLVSLTAFSSSEPITYQSLGFFECYNLRAIAALYAYIKNNCKPNDIIHVHLFPAMLYVSLAVRLTGWQGTLICTEHNTHNRRRNRYIGKIIDSILYSRYRKIICISKGTKDALVTWMPSLRPKLSIISNGIPLTYNRFPIRQFREKPIIISVGSLSKQKNYDIAIRAMHLISDIDYEYWIAGEGSEEDNLKSLCKSLNLDKKIRFLGLIEDVPSLLKEADIFLMPSLWEGFGLAAVEAMNAGLPLIVSDVPGLREIVASLEECALLVPPNEPHRISQAVRELLINPDKRVIFGKNAYLRSSAFSIEETIENHIKFYSTIH
nr:glycosyltransferase family 4 protein [Candidatus Electrothrix aestuarii]